MAKKVTIRDVAKLAGVSVATVSYVLNQKKGQKISDATRRKVLQVSNLLGYMHSSLVKSLVAQKSNSVSLVYTPTDNALRRAIDMRFFEDLASTLHGVGRELMINPRMLKSTVTFSDAIVAYNVTPLVFRAIGNSNFIPLIGVNVNINDPLFFQINPSIQRLQNLARESFGHRPCDVLYLPSEDSELDKALLAAFPAAIAIDETSTLVNYLTSERRLPVVCFGQDIFDAVRGSKRDAVLFEPYPKQLVDKVVEALERTISKTDAGNKSYEI